MSLDYARMQGGVIASKNRNADDVIMFVVADTKRAKSGAYNNSSFVAIRC